jgi:Cof subfamily protein (haloacid dehalogenase superfamily)
MTTKPVRKLLATDLDGTFLTKDGSVTARNRELLKKANENGLNVVFVTGRPARWLRGIADAAEHHNTMIGANGGLIADLQTMQVTHAFPAEQAALKQVVHNIKELFPKATFAIERSYVGMPLAPATGLKYEEMKVSSLSNFEFAITPGYVGRWPVDAIIPTAPIEELVEVSDITKMIVKPEHQDEWNSDTWYEALKPAVGDLLQLTHASLDVVLAEISAKGVTKGTTLAALAESLNLTREDVVAVGDMPNDIPMLRWAAEPWTVANAHADVLEVAHAVLGHHDDSPVADLMEDLINRLV